MQLRGRVRIKATGIAFCVAVLWMCNSWATPGLLLASVADSPSSADDISDTSAAASSSLWLGTRPQAQDAQAAEAQRSRRVAAPGGSSTEATQPPVELQNLAACVQETAPALPVSMDDVIAGTPPR